MEAGVSKLIATPDDADLVSLRPVTAENWRAVAHVKVSAEQREFVMEPSYYLPLCHYDARWHPLAIFLAEQVIGLIVWAVAREEPGCWLGAIMIDFGETGEWEHDEVVARLSLTPEP